MIRFLLLSILIMLIARAFWRVMDGVIEAAGSRQVGHGRGGPLRSVKLVRDPVCGTFVAPARAVTLAASGRGQAQYFCSERCRDEFVRGEARHPRSHAS